MLLRFSIGEMTQLVNMVSGGLTASIITLKMEANSLTSLVPKWWPSPLMIAVVLRARTKDAKRSLAMRLLDAVFSPVLFDKRYMPWTISAAARIMTTIHDILAIVVKLAMRMASGNRRVGVVSSLLSPSHE